jgi:hypothetical protein
MDLVNHTAVPAHLWVADVGAERRHGVLTAKATFCIRSGRAELDDQGPLPVTLDDPREVVSRELPGFEVMLIGAAEAPPGGPVRSTEIRLSVGGESRTMMVFGDRHWIDDASGPAISEPEPFLRMPLSWQRAFGGTADVEVDRTAVVRLTEGLNPQGRGFDAAGMARSHSRAMGAPDDYPILEMNRPLPNLESPDERITSPEDRPLPWCWAPVPKDALVRQAAVLRSLGQGDHDRPPTDEERRDLLLATLRQAHPSWQIDRPTAGARIDLEGMLADGALSVSLPSLRIFADYVAGDRRGSRELTPQSLTVLANEKRLCLLYRAAFQVDYEPGVERGFRLRLAEGWHGG